jgi:hypothetical protein
MLCLQEVIKFAIYMIYINERRHDSAHQTVNKRKGSGRGLFKVVLCQYLPRETKKNQKVE